jgi:ribosomal protein S18 acetylase RimI-like enzyme
MAETRRATAADAEAIAQMRMLMFVDAEVSTEAQMGTMVTNFVTWVRPKLEDGSYVGWLVDGPHYPVAGAGLWVMDWPPHFTDDLPQRGYLLNFYVAPEMRRQGLARTLLELAVAETKARGIKMATLHASKFGKPLYEQHGFRMSNEMRLLLGN